MTGCQTAAAGAEAVASLIINQLLILKTIHKFRNAESIFVITT